MACDKAICPTPRGVQLWDGTRVPDSYTGKGETDCGYVLAAFGVPGTAVVAVGVVPAQRAATRVGGKGAGVWLAVVVGGNSGVCVRG